MLGAVSRTHNTGDIVDQYVFDDVEAVGNDIQGNKLTLAPPLWGGDEYNVMHQNVRIVVVAVVVAVAAAAADQIGLVAIYIQNPELVAASEPEHLCSDQRY